MNTKKMAKRLKDSGVSPVIATILMVAITVVLAAVLYVMVSGFTHSPGTANSVGLSVSQTGSGWVVTVDKVSSSTLALGNLKLEVTNGSATSVFTLSAGIFSTAANNANVKIVYSSVTASSISSSTDMSAGDTMTITGTSSSSPFDPPAGSTFQIVDGNSILTSITLQ